MRIALVSSEYQGPGGIGSYTRSMAQALRAEGHGVYVLNKFPDPILNLSLPGNTTVVNRVPIRNRIMRGLAYRFFWHMNLHWEYSRGVCRELESLFQWGRIDIAEIPDFYGEAYAATGRFPYVCRLHTPWAMVRKLNRTPWTMSDSFIQRMEKRTLRQAAGISSPSRALLQKMPRQWIPKQCPQAVIPYPYEATATHSDEKKCFPLEMLFLGRLERRKGFDWVCQALPAVLGRFPNAGAIIAGAKTAASNEWLLRLQSELENAGLTARCRIMGPVSTVAANELLRRADVVMVPSRFDNFPNVVLEAMSAERCIIACQSGGIPEMVENHESALLFESDEGSEGLKKLLCMVLQDAGLRNRLGRAAGRALQASFSPGAVAAKTLSFYQEVLSGWKS